MWVSTARIIVTHVVLYCGITIEYVYQYMAKRHDYFLGYTFVFFFQAEAGIRDRDVTGVQTCALPICVDPARVPRVRIESTQGERIVEIIEEIGRAACRERVEISVVGVSLTKKRD